MTGTFYDHAYYESHYGRFLPDDSYYDLKARFWRKAISALWSLEPSARLLDYGCGLGQVSAGFEDCHYYDLAEFSRSFLARRGRTVYGDPSAIPRGEFDVVLSSHALEHTKNPSEQLEQFSQYAAARGVLILILPIERDLRAHFEVDTNNHLFTWTFQTITNLLHASGWQPCRQAFIYDSFLLKRLGRIMPDGMAVVWAWRLGRVFRSYRSMFIVSRKRDISRD